MIEKGNMTDEKYLAALQAEIKKQDRKISILEKDNKLLETTNEKLVIENECLKKDCPILLEALILSKHKTFGSSSEKTEIPEQQSFFNEAEQEYAEKSEEPVKKTVKGYCYFADKSL
ncbi:MAG: transposase [Ruminococcus sp.]|uniref:transposase n=1 Tax=Ruminococcus sp. TaxID=41978 RepID=UPI0025EC4F36|nr:transposase [Ruminococcus sp.]MCR5540656.1 transposase [Ruminococcus sp.]